MLFALSFIWYLFIHVCWMEIYTVLWDEQLDPAHSAVLLGLIIYLNHLQDPRVRLWHGVQVNVARCQTLWIYAINHNVDLHLIDIMRLISLGKHPVLLHNYPLPLDSPKLDCDGNMDIRPTTSIIIQNFSMTASVSEIEAMTLIVGQLEVIKPGVLKVAQMVHSPWTNGFRTPW